MPTYRERLESVGLLAAFERVRRAQDVGAMTRILETAKFTRLEIESVLWAKGEIGAAPTEEDRRKQIWDAIIGQVGMAVVSGVILGGAFVYASSGLDSAARTGTRKSEVLMSDYRGPKEAYYRPFVWGFVIGAIGGLVTGRLVYDPTSKNA
jgi:hypothetical protein